jgi:1-deoxy-D-xylulose-5-phosphate reductoisomerase
MTTASIGITILGSTGSIGRNTLDVVGRYPEHFHIVALTAFNNIDILYQQCLRWHPQFAVLVDPAAAEQLQVKLRTVASQTHVMAGREALEYVASLPQAAYIMAAIVGAAGLQSSLAAAHSGKRIMLANKEALVMSGRLFMDAVHKTGAELLPIDSEHNALFQCLPANFQQGLDTVGVTRLLLTASGGPFLNTPPAHLATVTPEQACDHPKWKMGRKISVDSATLMNKGLEVIEACCLFNAKPGQVQVVIHPQSIIHSLVEYSDGSVLAQLGNPDMRTPIAHALAWPRRISSGVTPLDLFSTARLDFQAPDVNRFPCLRLAYEAMATGGTATAILNAANEVAVQAFLDRQIRFSDITCIIEATLANVSSQPVTCLQNILDSDDLARKTAWQQVVDNEYQKTSINMN